MVGKIFITSSGYDPECGQHVKDPYLEGEPSLGACRSDLREAVSPGDYIFTITGKVQKFPPINQYVMCGFEVDEKITALEAYYRFPEQRLKIGDDGQLDGNVIVDQLGKQYPLDNHHGGKKFERRIKNFVVGKNLTMPESSGEIIRAREQTMKILNQILGKIGKQPFDLIGRSAKNLDDKQVLMLIEWLFSIKDQKKSVSSG